MAVDNNLINQICIASGLKGKDLEALKARLAKLSDTELQAELTKAIAGKNLTGDMGLVVEKTAKNNASTTEQKILSADGNTVEAVITYENNRPIKLTKFQNGNTIATTTFTYNVENDVSFVTAKTVNADKSTTVTTALEVDENGNISNEDIVDRTTTRLDGTVTTIYPHNGLLLEQVENPDGKKVLTAFNGTNIEEYDKKKLNRVFQQTENNGKIHYAEYDGHGNTKTTVQNGESPALIAQKFNVKENALRRLNSNKGKNAITQVGADILIPGEVNADEKVMTKRRSKEENLAAFTKQEYQRQADKLYSTEVKQTTLTKNYNGNFFNLAKDILIQNGKTSPSKAEITSIMQQLQLLNGNIPLKNGSRINVPGKKADTNEVNQLSNYGFKPSESTHGFYEKFNKLSENDKQSVLSTLQYLKSQKITEPNAVKSKLFEYLNINLFDSDKTIPMQGINSNNFTRKVSTQTVPLEVYLTEYLGLDINNQDGKEVYTRLNSLPQEELNKLSAQDFVNKGAYAADPNRGPTKALKGKKFDEVASTLASKGVVIQTQSEIQRVQNSPQNIKRREEIQTRQMAAANIEIMYEQAIAEIQNYQNSQGWFNVGYWREKLGNLIKNDYVDTSFEATVERLTKEKKLVSSRLKTVSYNASEFNALFKKLTGVEYDKTKVEKFIEEANKENNDWSPAYEAAFGSKMLDWAKLRVKQVSTTDGLGDIAAMLIGTEAIAGTAAFKGTVKGVGTQVGKVVGEKTTQVVSGMAAGGVNLGTWTLLSGTVNNLTASGIDAKSWETWKQTGIATIESAGFGAAGGLINATVVDKVVKGVSKAMEKPAAKALNAVEKSFENGTAKTGTEIMTTYIMNETPGILAKSAGFVTEVAGFTAYETALDLCKDFFTKDGFNEASMREKLVELGKDANEVKNMHGADLVASYLGNTALGQVKMLGEVKGIANLMMMRQGGKTAQALAYKEGLSKCEALKDLKVKPITVNGKEVYEVTYPNGNRAVAGSVTEIIGNCQFLLQMEQLKNIAKIQLSEELHTPKGEISEASKTNPAENAKEKVLSEVAKDMTDDGMKLWTSEALEAELDFAEKNPNAPQENLEAMSLVINGKLGKHLTKMYADLGKSFEDVITKHSDEISHLENKYKNNSKKFAQAFTEFLAKRLGVSGIAPKVEFAEMEDCHGYFDWPNGKLMVSKELVSNPKAIETIIAHEFVHVIQFKDIIAAKGKGGIHEILSSLNNGVYLENVTRSTIERNGIDYSELSSEDIADYKFVCTDMLAEDVMRTNSKLVEFAKNHPIEKGSLKSYLSEIYKNEHSNYVDDVNSSEYYNQVIESEAYYLGNGRIGKGIIEKMDLFKVKIKKSPKTNSPKGIIKENSIPEKVFDINKTKEVFRELGFAEREGYSSDCLFANSELTEKVSDVMNTSRVEHIYLSESDFENINKMLNYGDNKDFWRNLSDVEFVAYCLKFKDMFNEFYSLTNDKRIINEALWNKLISDVKTKKLTENQHMALNDFIGDGYGDINSALTNLKNGKEVSEHRLQEINDLHDLIEGSSLPEDTKMNRVERNMHRFDEVKLSDGTSLTEALEILERDPSRLNEFNEKLNGVTIENERFMSATLRDEHLPMTGLQVQLNLPKGSKALFRNTFISSSHGEMEYIIQKDSKMTPHIELDWKGRPLLVFDVKTPKIEIPTLNYPKGRIEIQSDKKTLEGGIKPEELDEVAPFARHLSNEVTDPIAILGDNFDKRVNTVYLKPHETVGMPLKYSVHDFADNIKSLVNNLKIEEQQAILEKFNINLVYTGEGFEISSIPKIPSNKEIKTSLERKISEEIIKFTTENEFEINNPELKVFLDDFVKVVPEFLFTVGKKQHATHAYTLDVHILKTLQNATEHPEYKNLSQEDKMVINTALMLHDIGKRFIDEQTPDENHADISYKAAIPILDRFNLPSDTKQRIAKLIENHEFYKNYNASYTSFLNEQAWNAQGKAEADEHGWSFTPKTDYSNYFERSVKDVAGRFVNLQDAKLAKIFTFADLKSVNPEIKYTEEEWNNYQIQNVEYTGFHKKVTRTQTDAEFLEYIDKSMSYIEKELSQYKDNKIDDELVYPSELQKTSQKLFGRTDFFERIHRNLNGSFGTHRSDLEFCIQARKDLIAAGFKTKEVANKLGKMLKYDYDHNFDAQATKEFMDVFIANKDFIKSHNLHIDNFRTASALQGEIDLIKQKENIANTFTEFGVKDEQMQKRLSECLYIEEYQKGTSFNQEAYNTMIELFKTNKYTPEEIQSIIHNSFSVKNHRGVFRHTDNSDSYFNKEIYNTILELAKEEPLENAINDAHLCFESATPESGWVAVPELVEAVREFNRLGIKDKHFIKTLFDFNYKDGKNKYDNTRVLESVTQNEKYNRALEYAKQGFEGNDLAIIVNTCELSNGKTVYSKEVQDKIAELVKLGVYRQFDNCDWIQRNLFTEEDNNNLKFNHENYEFFMKMFETDIKAKQLDNIVYQSLSSTFFARKAAPDKILENGNFSKAQVEAIVKFYKEIGFDKIPYSGTADDYRNLAESFMDVVELTPEESDKMVDVSATGHSYRISKMSDYMAPFRYVNKEKFNQAMDYYKKGVDINVLKELTQNSTLHETLKNETDLSFIKSANDATLVANFWGLRDIKSINELSKSEKMTLMTQLMVNKSAIENNNVAVRISLLPTTSEGYAQMMKDLAHSFGFDKPAYTTAQKSQIQSNITDLTVRLQQVSITELKQDGDTNQLVSSIKQLIPEISETNIRTLQRIVKNPEFAKLSEAEQSTLTLATLFAKAGNSVDAAIDASVCAKRLGLSDTDAMNLFAIVKNSHLVDDFMSIRRNVKMNNSRSYATIISSELDELFVTSAIELKNYNNFQLAKMLYTANENYLSSDMLKEFAPDLYNDIVTAKKNGLTTEQAFAQLRTKPENVDRIEEIKIKAAEEYAPSRYLSKMMEAEIHRIKASDILLPQTDLQDFISKQSPEWLAAHRKVVNGRNVMVISSDEIPDFFHLSHTTQAFAITGKADATTNISNFEAFATLFDNKAVCLSYSGTGKTAVVGDTGLLIRTPNTAQYVARGTDISSIAKDIPTLVSEYISNRSDIDQRGFQSKHTKDFDRQYFSSMLKEELQAGYRTLLDKKLELEEELRNGNSDVKQELNAINSQMRTVDDIYIAKIDALIKKANGKTIDIQFIRENDAELAKAYDKVLSYINVEHRGNDGLMRTEYHNEVLGSNTEPVGIFVRNEKTLFELTDDYLKKAEEANWPVIILK